LEIEFSWKEKLLLLRPIRRAHVLMAQIPQHLPVFFAHPRVKLGSFRCRLRADSGMFCSTPSLC